MTEKNKKPFIEGEIVNKNKGSENFISERGVITGVVAVLVIAGIYFAYPYLMTWFSGSQEIEQETDTGQALEQRLAAIEDRVAGIEAAPLPENPAAGLEERIAALETALANVPTGDATIAIADPRIAEMEAELTALKSTIENLAASQGTYSPGFSSALAELAPSLYKSAPFPGELEQVRIYILEMPALDQVALSQSVGVLEKYAGTGIVSIDQLSAEFFNATLDALRTQGLDPDAGWWQRTWAKIKGQVVVRSADGTGGTELEAVIRKAEDYLANGEAGSALELVLTLPEDQTHTFQAWILSASNRVEVLAAFEVLTGHLSRAKGGQ